MPRTTSRQKIEAIERFGGRCHFVDNPGEVYDVAANLARESGGYYLDQFTYAERATDWRGNNNIAESIFASLGHEDLGIGEIRALCAESLASLDEIGGERTPAEMLDIYRQLMRG